MIVLSGNVNSALVSVGRDNYNSRDTVEIYTDVDILSVVNYSGVAAPAGYDLQIEVEQYATYANISGFISDDGGGPVTRSFAPIFATNTRYLLGIQALLQIIKGEIFFMAYQITVVARIIPVKIEPIH